MLRPRQYASDVAEELAEGLTNGTVTLQPQTEEASWVRSSEAYEFGAEPRTIRRLWPAGLSILIVLVAESIFVASFVLIKQVDWAIGLSTGGGVLTALIAEGLRRRFVLHSDNR